MLYRHKQSNEIVKAIQYDGNNRSLIYKMCYPCKYILKIEIGDYVTKTRKNKIDIHTEKGFYRDFERSY